LPRDLFIHRCCNSRSRAGYEIQYLKYYLPANLRLAAPPVYNTAPEYVALDIDGYIRRTLESFPILPFYDISSHSASANPRADWSWLGEHFAHQQTLVNSDGATLERRGLNLYAWPSNLGGYDPVVSWNNNSDLPAWFARRGQPTAATIGPGWFVIPCRTGGGAQIPLPVLSATGGSILICNAGATSVAVAVTLQLAACAPDQVVQFHSASGVSGHFGPFGKPVAVRDLRNGQVQQGFLPVGTLCAQTGGLLQLPVECTFQPQSFRFDLPRCAPGVTTVELVPSLPAGIVLLGIRTGTAAPADQPTPAPAEAR
ncbi:MAG: hypothetical protein WCR06_12600, partial [bacterium]